MPDPAARKAGMLLLLTALASVIAIAGRVGAGADQPTLVESLAAISDNETSTAPAEPFRGLR